MTAYIVDRVNTTGTVWLGLTIACAQCHDHKYDPITQKEYYQLYAFFHNVPEKGLDGQKGNAAPLLKTPTPEQKQKFADLDTSIKQLEEQLKGLAPETNAAGAKQFQDRLTKLRQATDGVGEADSDHDGHGGDAEAARHLYADPRAVRQEGREGDRRRARQSAAAAAGSPGQPLGLARWLVDPGPAVDGAGHRQPLLADVLRHRHREDGGGFRFAR